ncbi:MAG: anti-sigma factor [Pyrinomonadaceae bacterium]
MKDLTEEQLLDLLCKKATEGLNAEELKQLEQLENAFPQWKDDESFEMAAATINLTAVDPGEKMPSHLSARILADAEEFFDSKEEEIQETFGFKAEADRGRAVVPAEELSFAPKPSFWQWLGWGVAAFACIALAVNLYLTRFQPGPGKAGLDTPPPTQTPIPELTREQKFEQLKKSGDVITAEMAKADPKAPGEISGDVVWNNNKQEGYIRFRGLPVNDPTQKTYQLWIFDEAQDEKYPIDGGIFDVNQKGEVIVPIDAKLKVKNPKMFAVTKEKPGGVVVSGRGDLVAVAKV